MSWMQTNSGVLDFNNLDDAVFNPWDIAHALSNLCRFTGHPAIFYSVADHCLLCNEILPIAFPELADDKEFKLCVLLHDAEEAYTGDISRPIKLLFPDLCVFCKNVRMKLFEKISVDYSKYEAHIKYIDDLALILEAEALLGADPINEWGMEKPEDYDAVKEKISIPPIYPPGLNAKSVFLINFNIYFNVIMLERNEAQDVQ